MHSAGVRGDLRTIMTTRTYKHRAAHTNQLLAFVLYIFSIQIPNNIPSFSEYTDPCRSLHNFREEHLFGAGGGNSLTGAEFGVRYIKILTAERLR